MAQHDDVGALRDLGAGADRLAAHLVGQRPGALGHDVGAQQGPAPPEREPSGHAPGTDEAELHCQLWLKKPFSMSCARSSAEISTLRGVSMNTLSAIRCMPPSSA